MLLAAAQLIVVLSVGLGVARLVGVRDAAERWSVAASVGLATLGIVLVGCVRLGAPPWVLATLLALLALPGAVSEIFEIARAVRAHHHRKLERFTVGLQACAIAAILVGIGLGTGTLEVPVYAHDGAFHAQAVQALRSVAPLSGAEWYPPALHAIFLASLAYVPWLDSAYGVANLALALIPSAVLAAFGLAQVALRSVRSGSAAAAFAALTFQYPYVPQFFSMWPLAAGIVLLLGLWTVAISYLRRPSQTWVLLAGLLTGGILLTHGSEVYSAVIGLLVIWVASGSWRMLPTVLRDSVLAGLLALICAAPYLPSLFTWSAVGGAVAVGESDFAERRLEVTEGPILGEFSFWANTLSSGTFVDAPVRLAILVAAVFWALRDRRVRPVALLWLLFFTLTVVFRHYTGPPVDRIFALTFPWASHDRLAMLTAVLSAVLSGMWLAHAVARWKLSRPEAGRGALNTARGLGLTIAGSLLLLALVLFPLRLRQVATAYTVYSPDDANALAWLQANAVPGDLVLNDHAADAGIWAPYKAGVEIVSPRHQAGVSHPERDLLVDTLRSPEVSTEAVQALCSLGIDWIYRGSGAHPDEPRQFPPVEVLRASPLLHEAYASGSAVVFKPGVPCPEPQA